MAHHGHHGYTKTQNIKRVRRERANEVNMASGWSNLDPREQIQILDVRFPDGAKRQRQRIMDRIVDAAFRKPDGKINKRTTV